MVLDMLQWLTGPTLSDRKCRRKGPFNTLTRPNFRALSLYARASKSPWGHHF